jgi:hypothetical protein
MARASDLQLPVSLSFREGYQLLAWPRIATARIWMHDDWLAASLNAIGQSPKYLLRTSMNSMAEPSYWVDCFECQDILNTFTHERVILR